MSPKRSAAIVAIVVGLAAPNTVHAHDPDSASTTYTVRRGDGFRRIARRTGVSVQAILDANDLVIDSTIHPGDVLVIPTPKVPKEVIASADLAPTFRAAAQEMGIPADLLMAVAYHESRWRADAVSSAGAVGIGQLMPRTSAWVARDLLGDASLDPRDATDNIRMSAALLRWLLDEAGGDVTIALAMYAQGVEGVRRSGITASTSKYIGRIADLRTQFD